MIPIAERRRAGIFTQMILTSSHVHVQVDNDWWSSEDVDGKHPLLFSASNRSFLS